MNVDRHALVRGMSLAVVLLAGLAMWTPHLRAHEPFVYAADEAAVVGRGLAMTATGDWNPHWFHYPTLYIYVQAGLGRIVRAVSGIPIPMDVVRDCCRGAEPWLFPYYYVARVVHLLLALGLVGLITLSLNRMFNAMAGLMGGLLAVGAVTLSASVLYVNVDLPAAFFVALTLYLLCAAVDGRAGPSSWRLLPVVVAGALAGSVKYNAVTVLLVIPLADILARTRACRQSASADPDDVPCARRTVALALGGFAARMFLFAAVAVAVFLLTTPYAVLDRATFFDRRLGVVYNFLHYASGHPGHDVGSSLLESGRDLLCRVSMLVPLALLAVPALCLRGWPAQRRQWLSLVLVAFFALFVPVAVANVYFERNLLPCLPALAVLVAAGVSAGQSLLTRLIPLERWRVMGHRLIVGLVLAVVLSSVVRTWSFYERRRGPDIKTVALAWCVANIPSGSRILAESYTPHVQYVGSYDVEWTFSVKDTAVSVMTNRYDYVIVSAPQWTRFRSEDNAYGYLFERTPVWNSESGAPGVPGPEVRIYSLP